MLHDKIDISEETDVNSDGISHIRGAQRMIGASKAMRKKYIVYT